jgi:hypothetical protein
MRKKAIPAIAAALILGTATMTSDAVGRGAGGGAGHAFGATRAGHGLGFVRGRGFRRFPRSFVYWYPPYYYDSGYDYGPGDAFGDPTYVPRLVTARPPPAPIICRETVTVPSEDGGTRQIKMMRC